MKTTFAFPGMIKGTTGTDNGSGYAFKAGDVVIPFHGMIEYPAEGEPSQFEWFLVISPTLADTPANDGSYSELPNRSIIIGNSSIYQKSGTLGKADSTTWVTVAMT